jgi:hypothetical protein
VTIARIALILLVQVLNLEGLRGYLFRKLAEMTGRLPPLMSRLFD